MAYQDQSTYNKFQAASSGCGCGESGSGCGCSENKCTCCPPGLVAVYDFNGTHIACLTPQDAQEYNDNNKSCKQGYLALFDKTQDPPLFVGCVSEDNFDAIYDKINPPA